MYTYWYAGIKKLEMQPPGSDGRRNYETTGVFSPDGEYLPFVAPIVPEGRPEEWLNTVEEAMFGATKRHLYRVLPHSKVCYSVTTKPPVSCSNMSVIVPWR